MEHSGAQSERSSHGASLPAQGAIGDRGACQSKSLHLVEHGLCDLAHRWNVHAFVPRESAAEHVLGDEADGRPDGFCESMATRAVALDDQSREQLARLGLDGLVVNAVENDDRVFLQILGADDQLLGKDALEDAGGGCAGNADLFVRVKDAEPAQALELRRVDRDVKMVC
eukprot:Amastigsp_a841280_90.p3 type:complete len:170 gc:universal Amastigsp_a841280_90:1614-1105(-)